MRTIPLMLLPLTAVCLSVPSRPQLRRTAHPSKLHSMATALPKLSAEERVQQRVEGIRNAKASRSSFKKAALALPAMTTMIARPAMAAVKGGVPFELFGKQAAQLFPVQNLALLSWSLYLLFPRWRLTPTLALISPTIHSVLYVLVLVHMIQNPVPGLSVDFSSLAGIMPGFTMADGVFAGWLHYCVFDPLVGLGIILDAKRSGVPHLLCVPCLILSALAGPAGFLAYLVLRTIARVLRKDPMAPPFGFKWGKTF